MKTEFNKTFVYNGEVFNISVTLNNTTVRSPGGATLHLIRCNSMGQAYNYYAKKLCETSALSNTITTMQKDAENWLNSKLDNTKSPEQEILEQLGFK